MEQSLTPREIQARIRSGDSLDDVVDAAGMPRDRVLAFAGPVLAEREHMVGLALAAPVRRRGETASTRGLRSTVAERLTSSGVDVDDMAWDAWKRPDGLWRVQGAYTSGGTDHVAVFTFDQRGRFSVADNDDARWLISESVLADDGRGRRRRANPDDEPTVELEDDLALVRATMRPGQGTYTAGDDDEPDPPDYTPAELEEVDGVYDLVMPKTEMDVLYEMISGIDEDSVRIYTGLSQPVTQERDEPQPEPEPDAPSARRRPAARSGRPAKDEATRSGRGAHGAADATRADDRRSDPAAETPAAEPSAAPVEQASPEAAAPRARRAAAEPSTPPPAPADDQPALLDQDQPQEPTRPKPKRRRSKRASVPSWDEIMFGGPGHKG